MDEVCARERRRLRPLASEPVPALLPEQAALLLEAAWQRQLAPLTDKEAEAR